MIEIIEKEPFRDTESWTGSDLLYPNYMLKDGKEYFIFNRREPDLNRNPAEKEEMLKQLINTGGAYFRLYGVHDDPFELLEEISERKESFICENIDEIVFLVSTEEFVDFRGRRSGLSVGFFYRIYDMGMAAKIKKAVEHILNGEHDKVKGDLAQEQDSGTEDRLNSLDEEVTLCTFPDSDVNYCKKFVVPRGWLLDILERLDSVNERKGVDLENFLQNYVWDETHFIYLQAKTDGKLIREEAN